MTTKPPPLTLFDASQFDFETDQTAKTPARVPGARPCIGGIDIGFVPRSASATADATAARRRRSRARLAKRRYLADRDGYERMEQTRRALHLVDG